MGLAHTPPQKQYNKSHYPYIEPYSSIVVDKTQHFIILDYRVLWMKILSKYLLPTKAGLKQIQVVLAFTFSAFFNSVPLSELWQVKNRIFSMSGQVQF